jgi:predicted RNA-binding protein with PIN domain
MVMAAKHPGRICVVTNDNLIRNCAYAHGASAMRVQEFVKRLDYSIDQVSRRANLNQSRSRSEREPFHNRIEFPEGNK